MTDGDLVILHKPRIGTFAVKLDDAKRADEGIPHEIMRHDIMAVWRDLDLVNSLCDFEVTLIWTFFYPARVPTAEQAGGSNVVQFRSGRLEDLDGKHDYVIASGISDEGGNPPSTPGEDETNL